MISTNARSWWYLWGNGKKWNDSIRIESTPRGDISDQRAGVRSNVRVGRAELRQIGIAERIPLGVRLDRAAAIDVQQDDPGIRIHVAPPRNRHKRQR